MPIKPTYLNDDLYQYLVENFSCDTEYLLELKAKSQEAGLPQIYITPEQGKFIQTLLRAIGAKNILEIGTLGAYSAIVMADALPKDGKIITVDKNEQFIDFAQTMIDKFGYSDKIQIIKANARHWVKEQDMPEYFDFVFIDADKPGYKTYLDYITPMLRKGGVLAVDNAFAFGFILETLPERNPDKIKSMRSFNEYLNNHPEYDVSLVPIGDGMLLGVKK